MADNDYNIIKPVDGLQNIRGLTPAKRREERKRRQNLPAEHAEQPEAQPDGTLDQQDSDKEPDDQANDQHLIDYRA
jgi:hypothetical protein